MNMTYCRHVMVKTRVLFSSLSRTVIAHPSLMSTAIKLYGYTRARRSRGLVRYLPSRRYIAFRIKTQFGNENIDKFMLREDLFNYLKWVKETK